MRSGSRQRRSIQHGTLPRRRFPDREGRVRVAVVLKQYGERRTGTNYLRALLLANYPAAVPLMHVLGDKHSPPVAFDRYWREAQADADPDWSFVSRATFSAPSSTTSEQDENQRNEIQRVAAHVAAAYKTDSLGFLISIKDPYSWLVSVARYLGWALGRSRVPFSGALDRARIPSGAYEYLEQECHKFNRNYTAWFDWAAKYPLQTLIVRYEDLLSCREDVLKHVEEKFDLRRGPEPIIMPQAEVLPPEWDHSTIPLGSRPFDSGYYTERRYLGHLPDGLHNMLTTTIDWGLMRTVGYFPVNDR